MRSEVASTVGQRHREQQVAVVCAHAARRRAAAGSAAALAARARARLDILVHELHSTKCVSVSALAQAVLVTCLCTRQVAHSLPHGVAACP